MAGKKWKELTCMIFLCMSAVTNKMVAHTMYFSSSFRNANVHYYQKRLLRSMNFASVVRWHHSSSLYCYDRSTANENVNWRYILVLFFNPNCTSPLILLSSLTMPLIKLWSNNLLTVYYTEFKVMYSLSVCHGSHFSMVCKFYRP